MNVIHSHAFPMSIKPLAPKGLEVIEDFAAILVQGQKGDGTFFEGENATQATVDRWYETSPAKFAEFVNRCQVVKTHPDTLSPKVTSLMVDLEFLDWTKPNGRRIIELVLRSSARYFPGKTIGMYGELAQAHEQLDTLEGRTALQKRISLLKDFRKLVGAVVCSVYPRPNEPSSIAVVKERFKWNIALAEELAGGKPVWCCWMAHLPWQVTLANRDVLTAAAEAVKESGHTLLAYDWTQGWEPRAAVLWTEALELLASV